MDKRAVRRACFSKIKSLSPEEKTAHSAAIVKHIAKTDAFLESDCVFTFFAMPSEPDLAELFHANPNKAWGFPRVGNDDRIAFHRVRSTSDFIKGEFGFLEPNPDVCPVLEPSEAGLILIPGVGFDPLTHARIGRGKGHYDRYLGSTPPISPLPMLFGVCFHIQLTSLSPDPHDVSMSSIFTEQGLA